MDPEWLRETVFSGSFVVAAPLAVLAGLVSFFSPCVIPLLPGYVSYATGISGADLADAGRRKSRGRMVAGTGLFVLGFTVVFVAVGVLTSGVGAWLLDYQSTLTRVGGAIIIVMGLAFMGALPVMQREWRLHKIPAVGLGAAPLLGMIFAIGWVPCVGPTLGAIVTLGMTEANVVRGGVLAALYSVGLGIPFVILGFTYQKSLSLVAWVRSHQVWVTRLGGLMLVAVGLLLVSGVWEQLIRELQVRLAAYWTVGI